jgi:hypothetical protein
MGWKIFDEAVDMVDRRFRYLPHIFRWRGQRYEVETVERCWTVAKSAWRRRVERRFFRVRCGEDTFELYQDLRTSTWHLRRARLASGQALPVRRMLPVWQ